MTFTNKQKRRIATQYARAFNVDHPINDVGDGFCDGYANVDGTFQQGKSTRHFYDISLHTIDASVRADRAKYALVIRMAMSARKRNKASHWPIYGRFAKV